MPQLHTTLAGHDERPIALDLAWPDLVDTDILVVFVHGFKGFKDWGHFPLIQQHFVAQGYPFLKFNFSHNGTSPEAPTDYVDLDAFGRNTFSRELDDLKRLLDHIPGLVKNTDIPASRIVLIGHSRGGPVVLITAVEDHRISQVITWAGVSQCTPQLAEPELTSWKREGVRYIQNARTGQAMPMYFSFYEDCLQHAERYDLSQRLKHLDKPHLIIHGTEDVSVAPLNAERLAEYNPDAHLVWIEGGDHTFGGRHPWIQSELPDLTRSVLAHTLDFIKKH